MKRHIAYSLAAICIVGAASLPVTAGTESELERFAKAFEAQRDFVDGNGAWSQRRHLKLFGSVVARVRKSYVEETNPRKLVDEAIKGFEEAETPVTGERLIEAALSRMVHSLDPHSVYLNRQRYKDMRVQTRGEFGGLGIRVTMEDDLVKVVSPIDDTPASRAGIIANDKITHLDKEPVKGWTLSKAVQRMRGEIHTKIVLTILRGDGAPFDVTIVRDVIRIKPVKSRVEDDIAYIRVSAFNERTENELDKAMKTLRKEMGSKLRGVVVDLRNNPGGLLDQSVAVADAFLEHGNVVSTRGRLGRKTQKFDAHRGDIAKGLPMVVLINGGSASASEIVAGALQDHRRATLIGTKSFGKGSVQTIFPLSGERAVRLTTSRYYTPHGRSIQAKGIEPDIEVVRPGENAEQQAGMRREADLPGALDVVGRRPSGEAKPKAAKEDEQSEKPKANSPPKAEDEVDYQLRWALNFVRATADFKIDVVDRPYVAVVVAAAHQKPKRDAPRVSKLEEGMTVKVVGRVRGQNWLLVDRGDSNLAYVNAESLAPRVANE